MEILLRCLLVASVCLSIVTFPIANIAHAKDDKKTVVYSACFTESGLKKFENSGGEATHSGWVAEGDGMICAEKWTLSAAT